MPLGNDSLSSVWGWCLFMPVSIEDRLNSLNWNWLSRRHLLESSRLISLRHFCIRQMTSTMRQSAKPKGWQNHISTLFPWENVWCDTFTQLCEKQCLELEIPCSIQLSYERLSPLLTEVLSKVVYGKQAHPRLNLSSQVVN
jgi:hypothetical protein